MRAIFIKLRVVRFGPPQLRRPYTPQFLVVVGSGPASTQLWPPQSVHSKISNTFELAVSGRRSMRRVDPWHRRHGGKATSLLG